MMTSISQLSRNMGRVSLGRRARAGAAIVICSIVALGCSTEVRAASATQALTKVEFQHRANDVCRAYGRKIEALPIGLTYTRAVAERWAALLTAQERQLAKLTPPQIYATRFRKMLAVARPIPRLVLDWDAADRTGDTQRAQRLQSKLERLADERTRLAKTMGLAVCANQ